MKRLISFRTISLIAVTAVILPVRADAQLFCSEPLQPVCFDTLPNPSDGPQVARCLEDAAEFEAAAAQYIACVEDNLAAWREESANAIAELRCTLDAGNDDACGTPDDTADEP